MRSMFGVQNISKYWCLNSNFIPSNLIGKWNRLQPTKVVVISGGVIVNPFKPEFTIVIFIHYKSRIAVAILDL